MKLVIVAPDVTDKGLAASFRIGVFIEEMLKKGHSVLLFTEIYWSNSTLFVDVFNVVLNIHIVFIY